MIWVSTRVIAEPDMTFANSFTTLAAASRPGSRLIQKSYFSNPTTSHFLHRSCRCTNALALQLDSHLPR
eukprot:m.52582 g.52582  ORF g.52582 m.52582 type:complete len:69 (+) comp13511_c0_seq2:1120-1326(+)